METLRNAVGKIIGTIRENGSVLKLYNSAGKVLGSYDTSSNVTKDSGGTVIGTSGNLLVSLLKN